jgi:hypothetical protein
MANLSLVGQIPVEIDHAFAITCTRVDVSNERPQTFKASAFGSLGAPRGIGPVKVTLTFAIPSTGPEFRVSSLATGQHTISITLAPGIKKLALGCELGPERYSNDPAAGNSEITLEFMGTDFVDN